MTGEEFGLALSLLESVWKQELTDADTSGYRTVLMDLDGPSVLDALSEMCLEDRVWMPKAPEIAHRALRIARYRSIDRALAARRERIARGLAVAEVKEVGA